MNQSTSYRATGKIHEVKGAIRQKVGEITNNPELEDDGKSEKIAGKVQSVIGKIEKVAGK